MYNSVPLQSRGILPKPVFPFCWWTRSPVLYDDKLIFIICIELSQKVFIISMRQYLERLIFILYSFSMRKTFYMQKSLKIPKGQTVYRRRIDNTMTKRKSTKGQTTIYKALHIQHMCSLFVCSDLNASNISQKYELAKWCKTYNV